MGRLDYDTEGLLLLTNDGSFSLRLTHPRYKMPKTYTVEVEGALDDADRKQLLAGVQSEGELLSADEARRRFAAAWTPVYSSEEMPTPEAPGRVLAEAVAAPEDLPPFRRAL